MSTVTLGQTPVLKDIFKGLSAPQARWLVDFYYAVQDYRIQATGQIRALAQEADMGIGETFEGLADRTKEIEHDVQKALDTYSSGQPTGVWAKSIIGIGPVLASGLMAHIDITRAPTVGHIWRFAGLDPTVKWNSTVACRELIDEALAAEDGNERAAMLWLSQNLGYSPMAVYLKAGFDDIERDAAHDALCAVIDKDLVDEAFEARPMTLSAALTLLSEMAQDTNIVYETLFPGSKVINKTDLSKGLSKRPWNAKLKVLCWKIGDSFVKQSSNERDVYGKVYRQRKELEVTRNEQGVFANQAAQALEERKIRDKDLRETYEAGRLPAGRLDLRARRYAVKLFLSHYHHVAYETEFGEKPPKPYILTRPEHTHFIGPPNWPLPAKVMENLRQ